MGDEPSPTTDADFEVISGPLPSTETAPKPPRRRYNLPRIAWQLWSGGFLLMVGGMIALMYLGTPFPHYLEAPNWADRLTFFVIDHISLSIGACVGVLALIVVAAEVSIRRRIRRNGRNR